MPNVIKVELPPGSSLLVVHSSGEVNQDLPSGGRQRPGRPIDPGYGVEEGGEVNQDLPPADREAIKAKLEEAKKAAGAKIDEIKNRPPAQGTPGHDLPSRLDAVKEAANAKIDEIRQRVPEGSKDDLKSKISAKVDEIKQGLGNRVPPDLSQKLEGLKQQVGSAIDQAKEKIASGRPTDPGYGVDEGNCGAKLDEVKQAVSAKVEEVKQALAGKGQDVTNKLEQLKADLTAKIDEVKASQGDPGYGVDEGSSAEQQPQPGGRPPRNRPY